MEGILAIQANENPRIIEIKLTAMLGEEHLTKVMASNEKEGVDEHGQNAFNDYIQGLTENSESRPLELVFRNISNQCIQEMLTWVTSETLVAAMKGLGKTVQMRLFDNMSERLAHMIAGDIVAGNFTEDDTTAAQEEIIEVYNRLQNQKCHGN
jgi:flagellar motor switch protein FliG